MSFKFEELLAFMDQPVHIKAGVILYENLKNWSLQDTALKVGELSFYNEVERMNEPNPKETVARFQEITIKFEKRKPDMDKGKIVSQGIKVSVCWKNIACENFVVSDGWFNAVGYSGFEDKLIETISSLHKERARYLIKGVANLCQN